MQVMRIPSVCTDLPQRAQRHFEGTEGCFTTEDTELYRGHRGREGEPMARPYTYSVLLWRTLDFVSLSRKFVGA